MPTYLDLHTWNRRGQFDFFRQFTEPFTGFCTEVDVTAARALCRQTGRSFFAHYLHLSLRAANEITPFRYRIDGERVAVHPRVDASATIARPDGSFGFSHIEYADDFKHFAANVLAERTRIASDYNLFPPVLGDCVIHYSSVPWVKFTSVSHARHFDFPDSSPKITFGKVFPRDGAYWMPMAVHAHHALLDGRDMGTYVESFQTLLFAS